MDEPVTERPRPVVVAHAGAGAWTEDRQEAVDACARAVSAAGQVLTGGGSATDAVVAAVRILEDAPVCNAGTGAVLTAEGTVELDACVMDGATARSGAVAALPPFRHPVDVAHRVLLDGRYHLLVAEGAAQFAEQHGFQRAAADELVTPARLDEFRTGRSASRTGNTVGAVALDQEGRLAAATSTGGVPGKHRGRIGDTPIVGAGTYAGTTAACSCTGEGEAFARAAAAYAAVSAAEALGVEEAARSVLDVVQAQFHGQGGLVLVDREGEVAVRRTMPALPHAVYRQGAPVATGA